MADVNRAQATRILSQLGQIIPVHSTENPAEGAADMIGVAGVKTWSHFAYADKEIGVEENRKRREVAH